MAETNHPFEDNGEGFPTADSVYKALGMFSMESLADTRINYRGQEGTMVGLITQCQIERLVENWPGGFIAQVVGAATQAGQ